MILVMALAGCSRVSHVPKADIEFRLGEIRQDDGQSGTPVPGSPELMFLSGALVLTNADVASARVRKTEVGPVVLLTFTKLGSMKFADITGANIDKPMGIFVDGKLLIAPMIQQRIDGGKVEIMGNLTVEEAERIANSL